MTPYFMTVLDFLIRMILIYYIVIHGIYFILIILGAFEQKNYHQGIQFREFKRISTSPLTPPVSIVICAYNEELVIVQTLLNVLQLRYPQFEVVVVNDGSEDGTLQLLMDRFRLEPIDKVFRKQLQTRPVRGVYKSALHANLIVVDKVNGRRADANNAGVDHARYPIICQIDADCVLEEDALLYMIRPFLYNSKVIAAGAIIRPSNGMIVENGRIVSRNLPDRWIPLFQAVEYLRSFQWARLGLTRLKSMLCISGAFTIIKKEIFIAVGGADTEAMVDDFELTVSLHRYIHEHKEARDFEITYIPDPGCYTQVPETFKAYRSQRNFWQRTILQSLFKNRDMAFNLRYGMAGMFGVPFYFIFEAMSAVIEALSYLIGVVVLLLRIDSPTILLLFFVFGVVLGAFVSICAILLQSTTRMREEKTGNLIRLFLASFIEQLGFRQFHVFSRLLGFYDLLIRRKTLYGYRERTVYKSSS